MEAITSDKTDKNSYKLKLLVSVDEYNDNTILFKLYTAKCFLYIIHSCVVKMFPN